MTEIPATVTDVDRRLLERLLPSPLVDRLNIGAIQTNQISRDQRRSFQQAAGAALAAAAGP